MLNPKCAALLASSLLLPGCGLYDDFFGDDEVSLREPAPLVDLTIDRVRLESLWSVSLDSDDEDTISPPLPHLEAEAMFVADSEGGVMALDPMTGAVRWRSAIDGTMLGSVSADTQHVYVGTLEQQVFALSREDGTLVWQRELSSEIVRLASLPEGRVAVRTNNARLYVLAAETGEEIWHVQRKSPLLTMRGMSAPFAWRDQVLVGYDDGKLISYDAETGKTTWESRLAFPVGRLELEQVIDIDGTILLRKDTAFVPVFNRLLAAVGTQNGSVYWTRDVQIAHGAASDGVVMILTDNDGQVWALNAKTGEVYWRVYDLLYRRTSAPGLTGLHAVVADFEGYLHWLRVLDGTIEGRHRLGAPLRGAPLIQGENIYLLDASGDLAAYRYVIAPYTAGQQPVAATEAAETTETAAE